MSPAHRTLGGRFHVGDPPSPGNGPGAEVSPARGSGRLADRVVPSRLRKEVHLMRLDLAKAAWILAAVLIGSTLPVSLRARAAPAPPSIPPELAKEYGLGSGCALSGGRVAAEVRKVFGSYAFAVHFSKSMPATDALGIRELKTLAQGHAWCAFFRKGDPASVYAGTDPGEELLVDLSSFSNDNEAAFSFAAGKKSAPQRFKNVTVRKAGSVELVESPVSRHSQILGYRGSMMVQVMWLRSDQAPDVAPAALEPIAMVALCPGFAKSC